MTTGLGPVDFVFSGPIGVLVKGDLWSCVAVPGSVERFGTGKAFKVSARVDEETVTVALLPTGTGGHMISISAKLRKKLGKEIGDEVTIHISERLT